MFALRRQLLAAACAGLSWMAAEAAASPPADEPAPPAAPEVALSDEDRAQVKRILATEDQARVISEALQPNAIPIEPSRRGDPMAIPFVVERCERATLYQNMLRAYEEANKEESLSFARYLAVTFPGGREAKDAEMILKAYTKHTYRESRTEECCYYLIPDLPSWVTINTRHIIDDPKRPIVQVGFDFYQAGQALREYPNVVVKEIRWDEVVYKVSNEFSSRDYIVQIDFEVPSSKKEIQSGSQDASSHTESKSEAIKESSRINQQNDILDKAKGVEQASPSMQHVPCGGRGSWVASNVRSILYDKDDPMVQIGFDFYREGQALREFPHIVVLEIRPDAVVFRASNEFASKDYTVSLYSE